MCLILFAYQQHHRFPLVLAANRDERFDRPTRPAQFWPESPNILAGKDLSAGGTWMGISRSGRFAAVTNFRGHPNLTGELSRGKLCHDFLAGKTSSREYTDHVIEQADKYAGFNLLVNDGTEFMYCNNHNKQILLLGPGIYGLSNGLLDARWPKINKGKQTLNHIIAAPTIEPEPLLSMLHDDEVATDNDLPSTGVGVERERILSPLFIRAIDGQAYGTCNSSAVLIDNNDDVIFHERSFYNEPIQQAPIDQRIEFKLYNN